MDPEKQCKRCSDWWPNDLEFYHRDRKRTDGLTAWCKACWSESAYRKRRRQDTFDALHALR